MNEQVSHDKYRYIIYIYKNNKKALYIPWGKGFDRWLTEEEVQQYKDRGVRVVDYRKVD